MIQIPRPEAPWFGIDALVGRGSKYPFNRRQSGALGRRDSVYGLFRLILAGEEHRDDVARYLWNLCEGRADPPSLISQRVRHVTLEGETVLHVDDEVLSCSSSGLVSMHVEAGALELIA
jgi:hypothetical protein